jgi:hypothetical protein
MQALAGRLAGVRFAERARHLVQMLGRRSVELTELDEHPGHVVRWIPEAVAAENNSFQGESNPLGFTGERDANRGTFGQRMAGVHEETTV